MNNTTALKALIDTFPPNKLDKFYPFIRIHRPSFDVYARTDFWKHYYLTYVKDEKFIIESITDNIKIQLSDEPKINPSAGPNNKLWRRVIKMSYFIEKEIDITKDEIHSIGKHNYIKIDNKLHPFLPNTPIKGKIVTVIEEDSKNKYLAVAEQGKDAIILRKKIKGKYFPLISRKIENA